MLATACFARADEPLGRHLASELREGLARRGVAERFAEHEKFSAKLFADSRGDKKFDDKTGNYRLTWVEQLVTCPAEAVEQADRFSRELMTAAKGPDGLRELLNLAAVKLDVAATLPPHAPSSADPLEQIAAIVATARQSIDQALVPLSVAEQVELRESLYSQTTGDLTLGHRFADPQRGRRVADLLEKLDRAKLLAAGAALATADDEKLLMALGKMLPNVIADVPGVKGKLLGRTVTPSGVILLGGSEVNEYSLDELVDVCAVIDLGGDDTYLEGVTNEKRPVLLLIDLAGNDVYRGERPGIQGGAILGASLLVDRAGNDRYTAVEIAQGSALGGVGLLVDAGGNDHYQADRRVQGQAIAGCGMLIDRGGDDDYRGALLAQGVGGPIGFGLLADLDGRDHYFAGGKYPGGYDDSPGFGGWSQGVGVGPRGVANGGIGVLLDGGGDDLYEADYFSHGGGYWFAAGIARDFGGNDQRVGATREHFDGTPRTEPRFVRWGTGYGCHFAAGFLLDDAGNDTYEANFAAVAYAWDIGIAALCDLAGDDHYLSTGSGVAEAHNASLAILYDQTGNDEYQGGLGAATQATPYHPAGGSGNFTMLLDRAGQDTYSDKTENGVDLPRGWPGAMLIDRR